MTINERKTIVDDAKKLGKIIIDYSLENCKFFDSSIYLPYQVNRSEIYNLKKDLDLCFIGTQSSKYRKQNKTSSAQATALIAGSRSPHNSTLPPSRG